MHILYCRKSSTALQQPTKKEKLSENRIKKNVSVIQLILRGVSNILLDADCILPPPLIPRGIAPI